MMFVLFGVFIVIFIFIGISMYRSDSVFKADVKYENQTEKVERLKETLDKIPLMGENDTNFRYAERVREASSIGLGMSIFLVNQRVHFNRTLTLQELMQEFARSDLLPPGITVLFPKSQTNYGVTQTGRGIYFIRYSPKPLRIEILAGSIVGKEDGAVFILRIPDTSAANINPSESMSSANIKSAGAWATVFEAPENADHYIPPPFSPLQTFTAMNWSVKPLQQADISPDKLKQFKRFSF